MSRLTPPLSLLSNLSALSASTTTEEENTAFVTEQFLPRKQDAVFGDPFVFQTSATNQHIRARLIMLSPFPSDTAPLAKSVAYLSSRFGSIKAEVFRTPGGENHFFRLHIFACSAGVKITLPPLFPGHRVHQRLRGSTSSEADSLWSCLQRANAPGFYQA
ncbi:hypothetical protein DFJ58DRAFT_458564 [Suillus subalutaceus]|uniref:uncharacterized protein n=1 Tax=Suillus subalutaceus TaxID=48586 RepID=UPI001B85EF3D|nr:uncharacterized protein DFJ58DRAFT_458564 [Suillus subalutaceus]KAG1849157.1 hypothetical protein DFJ58DRAFT_458564 [Suillus subalutaceus]